MLKPAASLTSILRTSLDGVIVIDAEGAVEGWNEQAEAIFGWSAAEVTGRELDELIVPERFREAFRSLLHTIVEGAGNAFLGQRFELIGLRKDGSETAIELGLLSANHVAPLMLLCFCRDLTREQGAQAQTMIHDVELAHAQGQLQLSEDLYRHVVELSGLVPWTADLNGDILGVSDRWRDWTGAEPGAALGTGWLGFLHPDDVNRTSREWTEVVQAGAKIEIEYRLRFKNGDYRWCYARATRRLDGVEGGAVWYGTLEDTHDRHTAADAFRRAQSELTHVSRLSAMGAMASAIAHELNQPLTAIGNYVRGSKRLLSGVEGPDKAAIKEALEEADRSIVRAGEIVRRSRDFVARGQVESKPEHLADLVEDACKFSLVDAPMRGITARFEMEADCPVLVDRVQIQQVLVNLIRNAVHALDGQARREIVIRTRRGKEGYCEVSVCDTGPGVPPEAIPRMFDPFYTTRKEGMGIGLSISRMIVEAHGGTIWNATEDSEGTTITFTLPASAPVPASGE